MSMPYYAGIVSVCAAFTGKKKHLTTLTRESNSANGFVENFPIYLNTTLSHNNCIIKPHQNDPRSFMLVGSDDVGEVGSIFTFSSRFAKKS